MENKILMPRLGVNDDYVTLVKFFVKEGQKVSGGTKIASIETAKETSDICSNFEGYIHLLAKEGIDIKVGDAIAIVADEIQTGSEVANNDISEYKLTEKAKAIIKEYNIDLSAFPKNTLIKEKDVLQFVSKPYELSEVKSNKVFIYGGGGFGKIAIDILKTKHEYELYGVIDSNYPNKKDVLGIPVIGNDEFLDTLLDQGYRKAFNAVGFLNKAHYRKPTFEMLKNKGFEFVNVIHKTAIIEQNVHLGEGNLICAGAIIGSEVRIGSNCIINAGSIISHDCIISDHCHIASGAVLAGGVIIGENTLIGQNCTINSLVKIGKNVVIQNGCSVFKDVKDNEVVVLQK